MCMGTYVKGWWNCESLNKMFYKEISSNIEDKIKVIYQYVIYE